MYIRTLLQDDIFIDPRLMGFRIKIAHDYVCFFIYEDGGKAVKTERGGADWGCCGNSLRCIIRKKQS